MHDLTVSLVCGRCRAFTRVKIPDAPRLSSSSLDGKRHVKREIDRVMQKLGWINGPHILCPKCQKSNN